MVLELRRGPPSGVAPIPAYRPVGFSGPDRFFHGHPEGRAACSPRARAPIRRRLRLRPSVSGLCLRPLTPASDSERDAAPAAAAARLSPPLAIGVVASQALVAVVAPALFVRWQRHKDIIHGPWDEAVPNICNN